jgi:hypothetical protein
MRRKSVSFTGDGQLGLFSEQIEKFAEVTREVMESTELQAGHPASRHEINTEDELYVEIAAACKAAIKQSGMSREQVLDKVNEYLKRNGHVSEKRAVSIHVFNNHLSKPGECPMRLAMMHAICRATRDFRPYRVLIADLGGRVVTQEELACLQLGKLQFHSREIAKVRRALTKKLCGATISGSCGPQGARLIGQGTGFRHSAK